MKKIFVLACLLALVAIMAVPMVASAGSTSTTGTATVGGSIAAPTITCTAPSGLAFGTLVASATLANDKTATAGSINVTAGSGSITGWTVTVAHLSGPNTLGFLAKDATTKLTDPLLVAKTSADPFWTVATLLAPLPSNPLHGTTYTNSPLIYTGSASGVTSLPFFARQWVEVGDVSTTGTFSLSLTFTATVNY